LEEDIQDLILAEQNGKYSFQSDWRVIFTGGYLDYQRSRTRVANFKKYEK
jgi:hypothetical protein